MDPDILELCKSVVNRYFESNKHIVEFMNNCFKNNQSSLIQICINSVPYECLMEAQEILKTNEQYTIPLNNLLFQKIDELVLEKTLHFVHEEDSSDSEQ